MCSFCKIKHVRLVLLLIQRLSNMYWSLLIATCLVVLVSAAPDSSRLSLKDPRFQDSRIKFHSSKHLEKEWQSFKINYSKATSSIFRKERSTQCTAKQNTAKIKVE